jgi:ATP-binding cassette subfamily B protein
VSEWKDATWSVSHAPEAISALARAAGLPVRRIDRSVARLDPSPDETERWVQRTADWLGLEAEAVDTSYAQVGELLRGAGPAIVRLDTPDGARVAGLLRAGSRTAVLVTADGQRRVSMRALRSAVVGPLEAHAVAAVERMLDVARVPPRRRHRARELLLQERMGPWRIGGVWVLRRPASAPFLAQLVGAGALRDGAVLVASHAAQYAVALLSWWTIGRGALQGYLDPGWLVAWAMLLTTLVPLRLLELRAQGRVAIESATLLKRRLLTGALGIGPEAMRGEGAGQLLGRTLEASAVESLATSGGLTAGMATLDVVVSTVVLAISGGLLPLAAIAAVGLIGTLAARAYWRARVAWTDQRIALTHDLVERMTGHRTRLAQQPNVAWHAGEDEDLVRYLAASSAVDRRWIALGVLVPAACLLAGLASLSPMLASSASSPTALAVALGGVLLAFRASQKLAVGIRSLVSALVAWRRVAPLFEAGGQAERATPPEPMATRARAPEGDEPVLTAQDVVFRYRAGGDPVLRGCTLRVAAHDRVLLEGPSGGGKSTLALLLAGVRTPESGTLLAGGLDLHTLGARDWRRRVVTVPQFHENHVLSATFAFNLLMGRAWPPRDADVQDAEGICRELGLGALLERMPAGLQQIVGDTGWQLSHGERSRLYVARALLQSPEVLVLDESFAALDPETMQVALECVRKRASALIVVAHP